MDRQRRRGHGAVELVGQFDTAVGAEAEQFDLLLEHRLAVVSDVDLLADAVEERVRRHREGVLHIDIAVDAGCPGSAEGVLEVAADEPGIASVLVHAVQVVGAGVGVLLVRGDEPGGEGRVRHKGFERRTEVVAALDATVHEDRLIGVDG